MKFRGALAAVLLSASVIVPFMAPAACAAQSDSAALVIDLGEEGGVLRYCVVLEGSSVSGSELIQLAGQQYGLDYRIDQGGVCRLAGVGPASGDCFGDYPYFWGYWRGEPDGGWSWSSLGAASTSVEAGDVEGWAWGTGQDGSSHPQPPATTHAEVCPDSGTDEADQGPKGTQPAQDHSQAPGAQDQDDTVSQTSGGPTPAPEKGPRARERVRKDRTKQQAGDAGDRSEPIEEPAEPLPATAPPVAASAPGSPPGPPVAGIAGSIAALMLVVAGMLVSRRRSREPG